MNPGLVFQNTFWFGLDLSLKFRNFYLFSSSVRFPFVVAVSVVRLALSCGFVCIAAVGSVQRCGGSDFGFVCCCSGSVCCGSVLVCCGSVFVCCFAGFVLFC